MYVSVLAETIRQTVERVYKYSQQQTLYLNQSVRHQHMRNLQDPLPMIRNIFVVCGTCEKYKPNEADGWWSPETCEAMDTVAIVIPYRNREHYLQGFLQRMHPLLRKQLLRYQIFVIDQSGEKSLTERNY